MRHQLASDPEHAGGASAVDESVTLRRYMYGEQLNEDERFLRDYVLNAMWKNPAAARGGDDAEGEGEEEEGGGGRPGADGDGEDEDEDEFSDRADDFERKHNFRYEEAGSAQLVSHPRHDKNSIRRQAQLSRKKEAEDARKARKEEARAQKEAELKRLKNLKKREILDRLRLIESVSGGAGQLSEVDLSGDFDPEQWDQRMAEIFNDDYYAQEDEGFRAAEDEADDDIEAFVESQLRRDGAVGEESAKPRKPRKGSKRHKGAAAAASAEEGEGYYDDDDDAGEWGDGDGDYYDDDDDGGWGSSAATGGGGGGGGGFEALTDRLRRSGAKDGAKDGKKTAQEYMDEYYALDYEDLIGGDLPTRFKYRQVAPSGFGITDEEMLREDERTLSKRVPLRYVKRPYADLDMHDEAKLKGRANKVRWEEKRAAKIKAAQDAAEKAAKAAKLAAKAKRKEAKKQQQQQQRDGSEEEASEPKAKRKREATTAEGGGGGKRARGGSGGIPSPGGGSSRESAAAEDENVNGSGGGKAAKKLLNRGVSAQRLETFAKLGKEAKKAKKKQMGQ